MRLRRLVLISLLASMSFLLMYAVQIPLIPQAPFMKWDPGDLPNVLGGLLFGPVAATVISLIKATLHLIFKSSSGPIGAFMAFASSAAFSVGVALVYRRWSNTKGLIAGLFAGTFVLVVIMALVNYYWALGAWGIPAERHAEWVRTVTIPFNLLRGVISSALIYPVYVTVRKPLSRWFSAAAA